jgi:hypothetical protein
VARLPRRLVIWKNRAAPLFPADVELAVGCVLLVLSWEWFWESTGSIFETWRSVVGAVAAILGPFFIIHGWKRKPERLRCDSCGERVPVYEYGYAEEGDPKFWVLDCPRCGARYVAPTDASGKPLAG